MSAANSFEKVWHEPIFPKHIKGFLVTPSPREEGRGGVTLDSIRFANSFYKCDSVRTPFSAQQIRQCTPFFILTRASVLTMSAIPNPVCLQADTLLAQCDVAEKIPPPSGGTLTLSHAEPPPMWEGTWGGSLKIVCALANSF